MCKWENYALCNASCGEYCQYEDGCDEGVSDITELDQKVISCTL